MENNIIIIILALSAFMTLYTKIIDAKNTWIILANPLVKENTSIKVSERNPLAQFLFKKAGLFGKNNINSLLHIHIS